MGDSRFEFDLYTVIINIEDEGADEEVRTIPIDSRGCRFPEENKDMWIYAHYSHTACIAQCKLENKIKLCNCTNKQVGYHKGM